MHNAQCESVQRLLQRASPPLSQRGGAGDGGCNQQVFTHYYSCIQTPPLTPPLWERGGETHNRYIEPAESNYTPIASETLKCFEEAICSKDHARGPEVLAAWSTQSRTKVPRRGTFSSKQQVFSWLKFLCEALGRSSLRTKLRASSMHLHGLSNKIGSSTRSASSMHKG